MSEFFDLNTLTHGLSLYIKYESIYSAGTYQLQNNNDDLLLL